MASRSRARERRPIPSASPVRRRPRRRYPGRPGGVRRCAPGAAAAGMRVVVAPDQFDGRLERRPGRRASRPRLLAQPDAEVVRLPGTTARRHPGGVAGAGLAGPGGGHRADRRAGGGGHRRRRQEGVRRDGRGVRARAPARGVGRRWRRPPGPASCRTPSTTAPARSSSASAAATTATAPRMAAALGVRLLDRAGADLPPGGAALLRLARIDVSGLDPRLREVRVTVACDVDNPLVGPEGAAHVYGPQGRRPRRRAAARLGPAALRRVLADDLGLDLAGTPGAGRGRRAGRRGDRVPRRAAHRHRAGAGAGRLRPGGRRGRPGGHRRGQARRPEPARQGPGRGGAGRRPRRLRWSPWPARSRSPTGSRAPPGSRRPTPCSASSPTRGGSMAEAARCWSGWPSGSGWPGRPYPEPPGTTWREARLMRA